jgi:uncharacterized protein (TIGR04255 family)
MVEINEILPNPTVKQVSFEVRFPNLFFIESKIGELQMKVMEKFPNAALLLQKQLFFGEAGPDGKINLPTDNDKDIVKKIWQFKSEDKYEFNVLTDSINIQSTHHKTYMKEGADKFRDIIKFVMDSFFEIAKIPKLSRIGLRYIDECPIPNKENSKMREWYNTTFPLDRFDIADASEMVFRTVVKKGDFSLRYLEKLEIIDAKPYLKLDYDGSALNIEADNYLSVTDSLYLLIKHEFEATIKAPVLEYMKQKRAEENAG